MEKKEIKFFNEDIYYEKLDNGLEVYILPNNNVSDTFVTITTRYGGYNLPFMHNNKFIKVPNGIAHFLEHKMFEQENGIDPFMFFGRSGTYSNALTNYFNTTYVFAGNQNFKNNLNYLLDFIQSPYFTDENVEKEKGIIIEELKMYEDMPDRLIYEKILYNLFNKSPIKYSIGGSIKDVNKITKEDLYNTYNTFYHPSNMFIVITGKVNIEEAISIVKENQSNKKFDKINIKVKEIKEDNFVSKDYEILNYNINTPYIAYGIKIPLKNINKIDPKLRSMYLSTLFNILFDDTSLFYEETKKEGIIDTPIEIESLDTKNHKIFILIFKSEKYKKCLSKIEETLKNIHVDKFDLERKKKVYISYLLYILDDISESNRILVNDIILYNNVYNNVYELIEKMNISELDNIINKIDLTNKSTFIIKKDEK